MGTKNSEIPEISAEASETFDLIQEECSELIQIISKIRRFGLKSSHPFHDTDVTNYAHLIQEMGDVLCLIEILQDHLKISNEDINKAIDKKYTKLQQWTNVIKKH
jgi:NTP pyrophosphatase (non-canonical NTP hydrolase)